MKSKSLTLESFKSLVKKIIKEEISKPYKNLSNFQLQAYIIELHKEIQAYKSRGEKITDYEKDKLKLAIKDLEQVKAELASRKK